MRKVMSLAIATSRIGVASHDTSRQARSVVLLNWFCLLVLASDFATMPQYLRMNMVFHAAFLSGTMICYVAAILLNYRRDYAAARHLFSFVANLSVGFFSFTFGLETGVQMLFFVTPMLVFLIYPREARVARLVWVAVPVLAMALTTVWRAPIEPYITKASFSPDELRIQWISAYTWTFIFLISLARHFDTMAKMRETELAEALDRQRVAYGMVVHDISSYLANAQYAAFLLEEGRLEHKQSLNVVSLLGKDIGRLNQLVSILRNQLAYQSSLPADKHKEVNLGEAFEEAIDLLKARRSMSAPCVFLASDDASRLMLGMKRNELVQIIDNLASNASKAASKSNCECLVFLMDVDPVGAESDQMVTLSFSDNGPGISAEIMHRILSGDPDGVEGPKSRTERKSFGLKLISNFLEIFGGRLHYQTPAAGPMVSRQKAEGTWGQLPGTTILLDIPSSMVLNLKEITADRDIPRRKSA